MKIEIGESLLQSYLKNIKSCILTQTNWKTATSWKIEKSDYEKTEEVFNLIHRHKDFADVFKQNSLEQTLKQAELDVIGINNKKLHMIEVAFHENGLQYGDRLETKDRVCKKLLRAYLIGLSFFPNYKYEIIFASPKVNPATNETIHEYFEILNKDFSNEEKVSFKYISNDDFKSEIIIPTIQSTMTDSDSSDLFLRSVKMLELFDMLNLNKSNFSNNISVRTVTQRNVNINKNDEDLIQNEIRKVERKIPNWFKHQEQLNSKILYAFLKLYELSQGSVEYSDLKKNANIDKFESNFDQMKIIAPKNHAKIFEQQGTKIYLWEEIKDFVLKLWEQYR